MLSRREFLTFTLTVASASVSNAAVAKNIGDQPFLIIHKMVVTDLLPTISANASGTLVAAWRDGRFAIVMNDGDLGERFIEGIVELNILKKLASKIERDAAAKRFMGGVAIHDDFYTVFYQSEKDHDRQEIGGETPNRGLTGTEKLLKQIRSLPYRNIVIRSGQIKVYQ